MNMNFPSSVSMAGSVAVPHTVETLFPDANRIRHLAEQIRQRCSPALSVSHGQQATTVQFLNKSREDVQHPIVSTINTPSTSIDQITQAEELNKRLKEVVQRLQEAVKDFSLTEIQEQICQIASKLKLKFETQQSSQTQACSFFLICEAFYTEVCCQSNSHVTSVKVTHTSYQEDSEVLTKLLREHNFAKFECHLQVFTEFYKQASSPTDFPNMYRVLIAIEQEVVAICDKSPQMALSDMIMINPLGHVTPRNGGLPQYLTIFVHPYEVLKKPSLSKPPVGVVRGVPNSKQEVELGLGMAVKMSLEKSFIVSRLSVVPNLFNFMEATFFQLTDQNSVLLQLHYTLELSKPIPTCGLVLEQLHNTVYGKANPEQRVVPTRQHINQLISTSNKSQENGGVFSKKCRVVCLPGQRHFYFMPDELRSHDTDMTYPPSVCGTMLLKVTFCHPVHLFSIIMLLRKQLMYNTLLSSCLGESTVGISPSVKESEYVFDIRTAAPDQITVTMDTQSAESDNRIIVEFLVPDQHPTELMVKVGIDGTLREQPDLSAITRKCLSIPVTLRAALNHPTMLGSKAVAVLQAYLRAIADFNRDLSTAAMPQATEKPVSSAGAEMETNVPYFARKRKRTD